MLQSSVNWVLVTFFHTKIFALTVLWSSENLILIVFISFFLFGIFVEGLALRILYCIIFTDAMPTMCCYNQYLIN